MAVDQMTADLLRENEALRAECERLRTEFAGEKARECVITADDPDNPDGTYFVSGCGANHDMGDEGPPPLGELLGYRCYRCGGNLRCAADAYVPDDNFAEGDGA